MTCQQSVFKRYHSDKHFSQFYLQYGGKNQLARIDMEQNYVAVTLCIVPFASHQLESTNSSVNSCTGIQPTALRGTSAVFVNGKENENCKKMD